MNNCNFGLDDFNLEMDLDQDDNDHIQNVKISQNDQKDETNNLNSSDSKQLINNQNQIDQNLSDNIKLNENNNDNITDIHHEN